MKKALVMMFTASIIFLCIGNVSAAAKENPSWKEWLPATSSITAGDLSAFQSKLPSSAQAVFNNVPLSVQRLSVVVMLGLKAANGGVLPEEGYYAAFKIANKAAAGFYFDKAVRTIGVAK